MQTAVSEKPIIFSGPMVRAILDGRKTMTRRVVKPQPDLDGEKYSWRPKWAKLTGNKTLDELCGPSPSCHWVASLPVMETGAEGIVDFCPYGKPGDRLWVRETWGLHDTEPKDGPEFAHVYYRASDGDRHELRYQLWRPSIFMPRWASRITLEITDIRVERLQEITEADAIAEGMRECDIPATGDHPTLLGYMAGRDDGVSTLYPTPIMPFRILWDELNAERGYGWDQNPFVWVVSFKRLD